MGFGEKPEITQMMYFLSPKKYFKLSPFIGNLGNDRNSFYVIRQNEH
jgi:hypothetical protein